jgi:predicted GH43/DUF377 family glycosyl hydrolase
MKWKKMGLIYAADGAYVWAKTHAMIPTPELVSDETIRIYLTFCDANGVGRVGYVDVDADMPSKVLGISKKPVLDVGVPGTFDENGVLQCSVVTLPDGKKYLYYAGFELGTKIRYRLLSGLAVSDDLGNSFHRRQRTPILERSDDELYFRGGPYVMLEDGLFKMWYVAGSNWIVIDGKSMPVYTINYLISPDGINWAGSGKVCIDIQNDNEHGFGRPYVIRDGGLYKMFYSIRIRYKGYRLGYAESSEGINWTRKDREIGIDVSEEGWDSETICYSAVIKVRDKVYMFYNGNDFGRTGFGFALLESW